MILTNNAKSEFLSWYNEYYSYLSHQDFKTKDDFEKFLSGNNILIYSLILVWFDRFKDLGNGKTLQSLMKKSLKDYEYVISFFDHQKHVIEQADKIFNDNFGQAVC